MRSGISGCHLNPAVRSGCGRPAASRRVTSRVTWRARSPVRSPGAGILYVIASGKTVRRRGQRLRANGYAEHSPGLLPACRLPGGNGATFFFLVIILGATDRRAPAGLRRWPSASEANPHPPRRHPRDQHVGEPRAQHRPRSFRGRLGAPRSCGCSAWLRSWARLARSRQPMAGLQIEAAGRTTVKMAPRVGSLRLDGAAVRHHDGSGDREPHTETVGLVV
jgi:hypothetical protein